MYKGHGLKVGIGYEELDNQVAGASPAATNVDREMIQAGASYTFNNISAGVQYETQDNAGFSQSAEYEAWAITAKATFGNNAISAVYSISETENAAGVETSDTDAWGLAAEHNFSKRTKAYVAYASGEDDVSNDEDDRFSIGMIHKF